MDTTKLLEENEKLKKQIKDCETSIKALKFFTNVLISKNKQLQTDILMLTCNKVILENKLR